MSSHHIIREDQEPALVIDNASPENLESIQQLLEWSPTVMVTEHALEQVLNLGIKIDIVIAAERHLAELKDALQHQFPLKFLSCPAGAEAPGAALRFLTESNQKAVNIISDAALESFEKYPSLDVSVIQNGTRWVFIRTGRFEKWLPARTLLSVYPKGAHPELSVEKEGIVTVHRDHSFWISEVN
jgi:hypothetical protein